MLGKLFKYEFKATARIFLPLYIVLLVYSVIHKVIFLLQPNKFEISEIVSWTVYVMILVGVSIMTAVVMIWRFYKNLLSDEGYLMFTLPTSPWKHITSKLVVSMMWTVFSGIVAIISIFIISYNEFFISEFQELRNLINEFFKYFGSASFVVIVEALLAIIVSIAGKILIIYASMAAGQVFNRYRILTSLGAFIVLNTISQIIVIIAGIIGSNIPVIYEIFMKPELNSSIHYIMWGVILFGGLLSVGYFIITNYVLSKHLNLE